MLCSEMLGALKILSSKWISEQSGPSAIVCQISHWIGLWWNTPYFTLCFSIVRLDRAVSYDLFRDLSGLIESIVDFRRWSVPRSSCQMSTSRTRVKAYLTPDKRALRKSLRVLLFHDQSTSPTLQHESTSYQEVGAIKQLLPKSRYAKFIWLGESHSQTRKYTAFICGACRASRPQAENTHERVLREVV